jgi:tetratricopeptide (TPR) repeat protein
LLMVLLVQGYYYRFVDLPDFQRDWREHRADLLKQRGAAVDSLEANQIGRNIESGDVTGFNLSRNTYAAVLVLLIVLSAGIVAERLHDGDRPGWSAPILVIMAAALWMLYRYVQSKTAFATPVIGLILLAALWLRRHWIARHARVLYWSGVGLFGLGVAAVVGHGMVHGTLVHISLTFRWWYWVGAARVFAHHPWLGVGWANFGLHYPAYRLPQAAEDPADPHNFLVRAFVELGIVGGLLMVGWMLRLWWELTAGAQGLSPVAPPTHSDHAAISEPPAQKMISGGTVLGYRSRGVASAGSPGVRFLVLLCLAAMALNCAVAIDWDQSNSWIFLELFKRALFLIALLTGMSVVAIRSFDRQELDDRPAPLLGYAMLVGLGLFLLHNLIDFSLFEPGPMFLFALLAGGGLGVRQHDAKTKPSSRAAVFVAFILSGVGWIVAAGAGVWEVANAESLSQDADLLVRHNKPERARDEYIQAFHLVPINADYAFRAEQAAVLSRGNALMMRQLLDAAVEANPVSVRYRLARAELEVSINDLSRARADYQQILRLDPNNIDLRLEYAKFLQSHGSPAEAREQYQAALAINSKRLPDEVRKLSPGGVNQIRDAIEQLRP